MDQFKLVYPDVFAQFTERSLQTSRTEN